MANRTRLLLVLLCAVFSMPALSVVGADTPPSPGDAERAVYFRTIELAHRLWQDGDVDRARALLDGTAADLRAWEYHYLKRLFHRELHSIEGSTNDYAPGMRYVTFSPDGEYLAACADDLRIKVWKVDAWEKLFDVRQETRAVEYSPDGALLATGLSSSVSIYDALTGERSQGLSGATGVAGIPLRATFSPDGTLVAATDSSRGVVVWDRDSGETLQHLKDDGAQRQFAFSGSGDELAVVHREFLRKQNKQKHTVRFYDARTGEPTGRETLEVRGMGWIRDLVFSPGGGLMALAGYKQRCIVVDSKSGEVVHKLRGHTGAVAAARFSPDGRRIATAGDDETVCLWSTETGDLEFTLRGHTGAVKSVAFSPDGTLLASASADGTIKVWDMTATPEGYVRGGDSRMSPTTGIVRVSADGTTLVSVRNRYDYAAAKFEVQVRFTDVLTGRTTPIVRAPGFRMGRNGAAISADGALAATVLTKDSGNKPLECRLVVWDAKTLKRRHDFKVPLENANADEAVFLARSVPNGLIPAISSDGDRLVLLSSDVEQEAKRTKVIAQVYDLGQDATAPVREKTLEGSARITSVRFNNKGDVFAATLTRQREINKWEGAVLLFDAETGRHTATLEHEDGYVVDCDFGPKDERLATAVQRDYNAKLRGQVHVWDVSALRMERVIDAHQTRIADVAFTRDGRRLASVGMTRRRPHKVKLWDAASGQLALELAEVDRGTWHLAFERDGRRLVIADHQGGAQILELDAPSADMRYDRAAVAFVDRHKQWNFWEKPLLNSEIAERARNDESMGTEVRTRVRALLKEHPDDPQRLALWSWRIVADPESTAEEYREAKRLAGAARDIEPKKPAHIVTLATAEYRLKDYAAARKLLKQADKLSDSESANLALRCLLQYQSGDKEAARETLEELQQRRNRRNPADRMVWELFREAERLVEGGE